MASSTELIEELNCSICLEVFRDPITLRCGHNFCQECINGVLDSQESSGVFTCPQCRKRFPSKPSVVRNTTLRNIAEGFHRTQQEAGNSGVICTYCTLPYRAVKTCLQCETSMCERHLRNHDRSVQHTLLDPIYLENRKCPVHKRLLGYYCTEDSAFICASCMMDRSHRGHQVEPLDKALEKRKDKLREVLERVNSKTQEIEKILQNLTGNVSKIQGKANGLTKGINELFEDVIRQLEVLKDTLTAEVLLKTEQSLLPMTDHIQELEEEKKELLRSKCRIEDLCHMDNPFTVLQEHQRGLHDRVTRSDAHSSQELDVGQITRTLQTRLADITSGGILCFYMQEPTDLLLDVTTASNNVHISEDRRSATYTEFVQNLPDSSQRFPLISQVLSTRGFSSGRHYWDVETSHTGNWRVGVCYPSMDRKGGLSNIGYNSKSWCLRRCFGELGLRHNSQCLPLSQVSSCNHMRVYLDYEAGQLSFYELSDSIRHLHTFTATFTEPLHAAFMVFEGWLRVKGTRPGGTVRDSGVGL